MNDLLFYALLAALLYYFFIYLPSQKPRPAPLKPTLNQTTQTEPNPNQVQLPSAQSVPDPDEVKKLQKDIQQKERTIIGLNASYEKLEKAKDKQIKELQAQIRELAQRPAQPTNSKGTQTDELTNTLDNLIKDIQDLNNSL